MFTILHGSRADLPYLGHAPFADFHSLTWRSVDQRQGAGVSLLQEVDRFAGPALARGQIPKVYCAGLVFTNLLVDNNELYGWSHAAVSSAK